MPNLTEFRPPQAAPLERQRLGGLLDGFSLSREVSVQTLDTNDIGMV